MHYEHLLVAHPGCQVTLCRPHCSRQCNGNGRCERQAEGNCKSRTRLLPRMTTKKDRLNRLLQAWFSKPTESVARIPQSD